MVSAFGFLLRTQSPSAISLLATFLFRHFLVSSWYASKFSEACKMSSFVRSASIEGSMLFRTLALLCLSSSGLIASTSYNNLNGVNFVALHSVVLWDQMTFGSSSTHFPFFRSNKHFLMALKIMPLALSTTPLDSG